MGCSDPKNLTLTIGCAYLRDSVVKKLFRIKASKQEFVCLDFRQLHIPNAERTEQKRKGEGNVSCGDGHLKSH